MKQNEERRFKLFCTTKKGENVAKCNLCELIPTLLPNMLQRNKFPNKHFFVLVCLKTVICRRHIRPARNKI